MPEYHYACTACEHRFDTVQRISAEPIKECPSCNALALRRVITTAPGISFKGSGFYITDSHKPTTSHTASNKTADNDKKPDKPDQSEAKPAKQDKQSKK